MGISGKTFPAGWSMAGKPCDSCETAAAMLYCRVDSAFLCIGCDSRVHEASGHGLPPGRRRHERVWMCEVCEQAPASVTCKADAAALCVACDRDIHSANPLAHRHERVPVVPFYDTAEAVASSAAASSNASLLDPGADDSQNNQLDQKCAEHEEEVPEYAWIDLPNSGAKIFAEPPDLKSIDFLFSESDQLLDFDYPHSMNTHHNLGTDSVVPVQTIKTSPATSIIDQNHFELDFTQSKLNPYKNSYTSQSLTHSVSSSSMDFGVVPEGSSVSDISQCVDLNGFSVANTTATTGAIQAVGMDREARVLRYREKRKNRKFEKTIRYASRKAYAETRPRIKGRFAKRTEIDATEFDQLFTSGSSAFVADVGYGIVPTF